MAFSKKTSIAVLLFLGCIPNTPRAVACAICDSQLGEAVRSEIIHTQFLFFIISISIFFIIFLAAVVVTSYFLLNKKDNVFLHNKERFLNRHSLPMAAMLLGGVIAGFLDASVFHHILQTHAMVSSYLPTTTLINVKVNMFWDGIFELFTWVLLLVSVLLLWRGKKSLAILSGRSLIGWLFLGFGLFNFLESLFDHQLLDLHHVLQQFTEPTLLYGDFLFLSAALTFLVAGILIIKKYS